METITVDGKKFEKVKVDFDALAVGDTLYSKNSDSPICIRYIESYEVCAYREEHDDIDVYVNEAIESEYYTLKEIKQPEVIESAWYECLIPDQSSTVGDIFCTSVPIINTKYYRKVKPINETCTKFVRVEK